MCEVFDFAERGLGIQVTNQIVDDTTEALVNNLQKKLNISQDQAHQSIIKGRAEIVAHQAANKPGMLPSTDNSAQEAAQ